MLSRTCSKEVWGSPVEIERWRRIRLSVAAYAYEYEDDSIMSDAAFDSLSQHINLSVDTGNPKLDNFFRENFNPDTGMWVRKHPEKSKLKHIYDTYWKGRTK